MADTTGAAALQVQKWDERFMLEYLQENRFKRFMSTKTNAMIQVKEQLGTGKGKSITFAKVDRLTGAGVSGSATLEGNEEAMIDRSYELVIDKVRNATRVSEIEEKKSAISLQEAGRATLMDWAMEETRDRIIDRLTDINGVAYSAATEVQKDAWLVDNTDRVLFGAVLSNHGVDHSAALANVDSTTDKLTTGAMELMKRIALSASPKIKPITVKGGKRFYVMFAGPQTFRDLKTDATITQAQREVTLRMQNVKLFEGGDLEWDGIIVHEIDDIVTLTGVGAAGIDVSPVYLVGAQAMGIAWGRRWWSFPETFDYGDKTGISINAIYGVNKLIFGTGGSDLTDLKDNGVVTGFFSSVADS